MAQYGLSHLALHCWQQLKSYSRLDKQLSSTKTETERDQFWKEK